MTALLCTLTAFALILVLGRLKAPLALAILAGAVAAGLLFRMAWLDLILTLPSAALHPRSLGLMGITLLQLLLSGSMETSGQMTRIVERARAFCRRPAVTMAALPALIGLLPMPGGAVFSAPMVEAAAGGGRISGDRLSAINYWFRHIWEHWWPLYPGVLLAMTLTNRSFGQFAPAQIPLGLAMAASGLLLFRGLGGEFHVAAPPPPAGTLRRLVHEVSPIWLIVALWGPVALLLRVTPLPGCSAACADALRRFGPIAVGLLAGLLWTIAMNRLPAAAFGRLCRRRSIYEMLGLVVSVMVFQGVLDKVGAAPRIAEELAALRFPPVLAIIALPFIAGLVTGLAFGFVGASFPIVLGLVDSMGVASATPYIALAYACGHLGQMLTPIHLCYVLSNRHFQTSFAPVYRHILPPLALSALFTALYFLFLRHVL